MPVGGGQVPTEICPIAEGVEIGSVADDWPESPRSVMMMVVAMGRTRLRQPAVIAGRWRSLIGRP